MKYTNYLINGNFVDTRLLESFPKILLPVALAAALGGLIVCVIVLPLAVTFDGYRSVKHEVVKFERRYHFAHNVVESKVFRYAVIKPINVVVVNPIHNILKNVA